MNRVIEKALKALKLQTQEVYYTHQKDGLIIQSLQLYEIPFII